MAAAPGGEPDEEPRAWRPGYWAAARFHYFRDHAESGAWGVREGATGRVVAVGMDKNEAAIVAVFLNGDTADAERWRRDFQAAR